MNKPNIVLIVIDALRARNLSCYGYDKPTTPNLDSLADKGTLFEHCFSTINVTDPSFTTILSGKYPASHGMIEHGIMSEKNYRSKLGGLRMLQSILKSQGYITIGVDWLGRWHKWGFDHYSGPIKKSNKIHHDILARIDTWSKPLYAVLEHMEAWIDRLIFHGFHLDYDVATSVTNHAIKILNEKGKQNFFLFIHYWDTHMPYKPPQQHLLQFKDMPYSLEVEKIDDVWATLAESDWKAFLQDNTKVMKSTKEVIARYDASLHYVDAEIKRVVGEIKEMGVLENTIIVITADHGESLTEHGIYFDHHGLYDDLIHVPLIIYYPKAVPVKRVNSDVQHIDLVPTILDLAGIKYDSRDFDGKSLTPLFNETKSNNDFHPFIYVEEARSERKFAIRTDKFKYIFAFSEKDAMCSYCGKIHGGIEELYDLEKDPSEKENIVEKNPAVRDSLREMVLSFRAGLEAKRQRQKLGDRIQKIKTASRI